MLASFVSRPYNWHRFTAYESEAILSEASEPRNIDDEFAALVADLDTQDSQLPKAVKIAIVLTPLLDAQVLASFAALSEHECWAVPSSTGAFAVKELVSTHEQWDISELVGGVDSEPQEAADLAKDLSRLTREGVVLLTADLATDVGIETGLSGQVTARRYENGQAGEELSAGLIMSALDAAVEDILFGITKVEDVPGAVSTSDPGVTQTVTDFKKAASFRFFRP